MSEGEIVTETGKAIEVRSALPEERTVEELVERGEKIIAALKIAMREDEHYGIIPGTQKPTLLKAGAEKLCQLFLLDPEYDAVEQWYEDGHYHVTSTCTLYHIPTGQRVGSGMGACSTKETKYAFRKAERICPACGAAAIIKGKAEYGGGWLCWRKKDGCGTTFPDGAEAIEKQDVGQVDNPHLADSYNTVLKMANKRALVAGVLNATAASDVFTQDVEDMAPRGSQPAPEPEPLVTPETFEALTQVLQAVSYSELWSSESVLGNARKVFGRQIGSLEELTEGEAQQIMQGAKSWGEKNPPAEEPVPDPVDFQAP